MKTPPVQQQQSRTGYQTYSLLFMLLSPLLLMSLILNPEQITQEDSSVVPTSNQILAIHSSRPGIWLWTVACMIWYTTPVFWFPS